MGISSGPLQKSAHVITLVYIIRWGAILFPVRTADQLGEAAMNDVTRRSFLAGTTATAAAGLVAGSAAAGQPAGQPPADNRDLPRYRLGIVTYNIAATWDIPTILRVCRAVGLAAVELRTTHRHGVE